MPSPWDLRVFFRLGNKIDYSFNRYGSGDGIQPGNRATWCQVKTPVLLTVSRDDIKFLFMIIGMTQTYLLLLSVVM
jgi:hypothetical protein